MTTARPTSRIRAVVAAAMFAVAASAQIRLTNEKILIGGAMKIEAENNLMFAIQEAAMTNAEDTCQHAAPSDTATYLIPDLSNRLYVAADTLVCNSRHPAESFANIMLSAATAADITLDITQVSYGFRQMRYSVPLRSWITFCNATGCQLYFGIEDVADTGVVKAVVLAVNEHDGYNHVLSAVAPASLFDQRRDTVQARLYPYVPTSNVASLFAPYHKSNPKAISSR